MIFESHPERIGRLIDLLVEGQYRETACKIVGLSSRAVRMWVQHAESGDERYQFVVAAIAVAESLAEAAAVRAVRAAGKDPRFWAAEVTYLERKHPDRWSRRQDDASVPKVIVQIGVSEADVQVNVTAPWPDGAELGH